MIKIKKAYFIPLVAAFFLFVINGKAQITAINNQQIEAINKLIDSLYKKDKFSGTVLIAKGDEVVYQNAIGFSNKADAIKNNMETKFNLASMNKMFTAVAIAQLVEKGKLTYKDKLCKILTNLPKKIFSKVTIHQLLTHTSGTGDIFRNPKFWDIKDTAKSISTYVNIGIDDPLWGKPGTKFEYSNYGYILLGAVIEKLYSMSYYDYVKKNIFDPANMQNTNSYETDMPNANMAIGYAIPPQMPINKTKQTLEKIIRAPNTKLIEVKGTSAGGGYSTAIDLQKFSFALLSGKLVSSKSLEIITQGKVITPSPPMPANALPLPERKYGYGFSEYFKNNIRIIGHNGGAPGVDANFYIYTGIGYTVIILSNYERAGLPVLQLIQNILTQIK